MLASLRSLQLCMPAATVPRPVSPLSPVVPVAVLVADKWRDVVEGKLQRVHMGSVHDCILLIGDGVE
jgi:hypothetical protein